MPASSDNSDPSGRPASRGVGPTGGTRSGGQGSGGGQNRNRGGQGSGGGQNRNRGGQNRNRGGGGGARGSSGSRNSQSGGRGRPGPTPRGPNDRPSAERSAAPATDRQPSPAARSGENLEEERTVRSNHRRAVMMSLFPAGVLGLVVGVVVAVAVSPLVGIGVLVVVAAIGSVLTWRHAPASLIRAIGAVTSMESDRPRLHNLVDGLCATMGLPSPVILVVESDHLNAMAVGRTPGSASLIVTSGLDRTLSLVELEGVVAHELVHVKRRDTVLAAVAVAVAVPVSYLIGTEAGADLVHRLVGRGREFAADQRAATVVRYPVGLASALRLMASADAPQGRWPVGTGRRAVMARWLWIDPGTGPGQTQRPEGVIDDASVRADALSLL